jgi:predicted lipoprotein with Yx(FWY)xxD motif
MRDSMSKAAPRSPAVQLLLLAALLTIFAVAVLAVLARGSNAAPTADRAVVATAKNAKLGATILVDRRGMSLYDLSVERNGRFVCTTKFCLSLWHPLTVPRGTTPTGVRLLSTVRRPDGRHQVTYRGAPLYTFTQDRKRGDINGNGFKDVGVWHPAALSGSVASGSGTGTGGYGSAGY